MLFEDFKDNIANYIASETCRPIWFLETGHEGMWVRLRNSVMNYLRQNAPGIQDLKVGRVVCDSTINKEMDDTVNVDVVIIDHSNSVRAYRYTLNANTGVVTYKSV